MWEEEESSGELCRDEGLVNSSLSPKEKNNESLLRHPPFFKLAIIITKDKNLEDGRLVGLLTVSILF